MTYVGVILSLELIDNVVNPFCLHNTHEYIHDIITLNVSRFNIFRQSLWTKRVQEKHFDLKNNTQTKDIIHIFFKS